MDKSVNILFGKELAKIGYRKETVNHFEKKYGNHIFYVDRDFSEILLLRLMSINSFKELKCIESKFIKDWTALSPSDFIKLILETEEKYLDVLNNRA